MSDLDKAMEIVERRRKSAQRIVDGYLAGVPEIDDEKVIPAEWEIKVCVGILADLRALKDQSND